MWHVKCKWRCESACLCLLNLLQADQLWSKIIMLMCTPFLKTKIWKRIFKMVPSTGTLLRPWPNNFVYLIIYTGILLNAKQFWLTEKKNDTVTDCNVKQHFLVVHAHSSGSTNTENNKDHFHTMCLWGKRNPVEADYITANVLCTTNHHYFLSILNGAWHIYFRPGFSVFSQTWNCWRSPNGPRQTICYVS